MKKLFSKVQTSITALPGVKTQVFPSAAHAGIIVTLRSAAPSSDDDSPVSKGGSISKTYLKKENGVWTLVVLLNNYVCINIIYCINLNLISKINLRAFLFLFWRTCSDTLYTIYLFAITIANFNGWKTYCLSITIEITYMRCSVGTFSPMKAAALGSFQANVTFLRREDRWLGEEVIFVSRTFIKYDNF